ncbi:MAG: glycolate oxidase subunit GlcE [Rhodocyclaceae bacterium]|nr:glycolate oxidase subunit GlcE [Rhodocyclaceae bacterium]
MDAVLKEWADRVRDAAERQGKLRIRGGGSKDFYGGAPAGETFDTAGFRGIVAYEPTELVVVARAGTPLAELEAALAEQGQCLPFEPPHFGYPAVLGATAGSGATVGGMVAAGLSGPRRATVGAVRDYVLGVRLIDGRGELLAFGGQVMKNVAGYDVPRLMAGSLGTLGLIAEVSLKVLPLPVAVRTLRFSIDEATALSRLNEWGGRPLPLAASVWHEGALTVRLAGARAAIEAAQAALGGEVVADDVAAAFWQSVREQTHPFFAGSEPLWRLSLASTTPPMGLGPQLIEWGGALRWLRGDQGAERMRAVAAQAGGHATLFRGSEALKAAAGAFQPLPPALLQIHRRLKAAFDPQGVFNPGRMYPDF